MPRTTTHTVELNYEITGTGDPLVLVHGSWSDRQTWDLVAGDLAQQFRLVRYDRRGHGRSEGGPLVTRREHEDDLAVIIAAAGAPAHVLGTSYGGSIALGLAARRPELVRSLVVHEPPLLGLTPSDGLAREVATTIDRVADRVERGDVAGAAEQFVEQIALGPGSWPALPPEMQAIMLANAGAFLADMRDPDWASIAPGELAGLRCPVTVTAGDASPAWFAPIVERLGDAVPRARTHTFRGAGHAPHLTHPGDVVAAYVGFLAPAPV